MSTPPLHGIRVISLAEQYPGPYATMLLADLGADVIMVERPGSGDPARRFPGLFTAFSRGKRSVAIDLKSAQGHSDFLQLLDHADVVMEGFRPGVMDRLQLGEAALMARKPDLIYVSISSFGQTGPMAQVAGHDLSIQASLGMLNVPKGQESRRDVPMLPMADIASAMFAALGVVTALYARQQGGSGQHIDVAMFDSLMSWMTPFIVPPVNGLPTRTLPPRDPGYGIFLTRDQQQITLSIAGEDAMWKALCELIGLNDFAAFTEQEREVRADEIDPHLRRQLLKWDYATLYQALERHGIAFGPVVALPDVGQLPQVQARQMMVSDRQSEDGNNYVRQPLLFNHQVFTIPTGVPALGEHNDEVIGRPVP